MDDRVMVEVYVPTVQQRFDMEIPTKFTIREVKEQLCDLLEEVCHHAFVVHDHNVLYLARYHCALREDLLVCDIPIYHGDEFIIW